MSTLSDFPSSPIFFFNANNVDGVDNDIAAHGEGVPTWKDQGSAGLDLAVVPPGSNSNGTFERMSPLLRKSTNEEFVSFDGSYNIMVAVGSAVAYGFIHQTGIFDVLLVLRRRATCATASSRRVFGVNVGDVSTRGLMVALQDESTKDGAVTAVLWSDAGQVASLASSIETPFATPTKLLIRGDGEKLWISSDFYHWDSVAFGPAPTGSAAATNDYCLGGAYPNQAYPLLWQGDVELAAGWDRNLDVAELSRVRAAIESQVGEGA